MSGGGSSGGGGGSGSQDFPAYMKTFHGLLLDNAGADTPANSVTDALNAAYGSSPYTSATSFDPATDITAMETSITTLSTLVTALAYFSDFSTITSAAVDEFDATVAPSATHITNRIAAYTADVNAQVNSTVLPAFRAGMRDIGAVLSSAFTLGEAIITTDMTRQIAKYSADLYYQLDQNRIGFVQSSIERMATMLMNKIEYTRVLAALTIEQRRMKIAAKDEYLKRGLEIDVADAKWDIELFQYASNVLAGITGGTTKPGEPRSQASQAIAGALSGAAMGALVGTQVGGPGYGTAIGGVLGLGAAFL